MSFSAIVSRNGRGVAALILVAASFSGPPASGADPALPSRSTRRTPLTLTFVANEGVLVSSGKARILIDALFDQPNPEYRAPPPDVLDEMMKGKGPFHGVDAVLVTHGHPDHFDARLAARYLEAFPDVVMLAPADVVAETRTAAADWARIEPRVISLDVGVGEKVTNKLRRFSVTAFRTLHSGDREAPVNLVYLVDLNGWRVFHEGDSTGNTGMCRDFEPGGAPVDLALVHFWFPLEPTCASFLQERLKPGHTALMHLPVRLETDAPGKIEQVRKYYGDIFLMLPGMPTKVFR